MGLIRLVIFGFIGLSAVYFMISTYSRSVRREKLEESWSEENPGVQDEAAEMAYVDAGIAEYNKSFRPKLILLVYVVPTIVVAIIHIVTTYY